MKTPLEIVPKIRPALDPGFLPASLWNRAYRRLVEESGRGTELALAMQRPDGSTSVWHTRILPHEEPWISLNRTYVERLLKFLLWQRGGCRVFVTGPEELVRSLQKVYSPEGERAFDYEFMGRRIYGEPMVIEAVPLEALPVERENARSLGRHLDGCRIGFDLGGSDRKCAALVEGEVVHSEEVVWDPYFQEDPRWHFQQIQDSLQRAAAQLPRVDAIGGSAAGIYVNNEVRVASLFRGVPPDRFEKEVRGLFRELQRSWGGIPFEVVNDGEVTALAGSMSLNDNAVLGVAMGTSLAGGYVTPDGRITGWLNELAFAPVDYRPDAPADEWSGDRGVGVQYLSQQAVARLLPAAGIELPPELPPAEKLALVQEHLRKGDERARRIYETLGAYFGYILGHYADFYRLGNVLVLGRVMSGEGGDILLSTAGKVLQEEFPELKERLRLVTLGETEKRHGQAVAAASLPRLSSD